MPETQGPESLTDEQLEALYMAKAEFKEVSAGSDLLTDLSKEQTRFLFEASLEHGSDMDHWFMRANAFNGDEGWEVVREKITNEKARFEQAENAIILLGQLNEERATEYLQSALQQDALAQTAIRVLTETDSPGAFKILSDALEQDRLADLVIDSLSQLRTTEAVDLLGVALTRQPVADLAALSLERISKSRSHPSAARASKIVKQWRERQQKEAADVVKPVMPQSAEVSRGRLKDRDWEVIMRRMRDGKCTPILGPNGESSSTPRFSELAREWAREYAYPMGDRSNFPAVAEYVSSMSDRVHVEDLVHRAYRQLPPLSDGNSLATLTKLPLPVYITTNFDDSLVRELKQQNRNPQQQICRWNKYLSDVPRPLDEGFSPSAANPLVFHLFGSLDVPSSCVVTSSDYFEFLLNVARDPTIIPPRIQKALTGSSNLFLGFVYSDLISRVFFTLINSFMEMSLSRSHVAVMSQPLDGDETSEQAARMRQYVEQQFGRSSIHLYWGKVEDFSAELRKRWEESYA